MLLWIGIAVAVIMGVIAFVTFDEYFGLSLVCFAIVCFIVIFGGIILGGNYMDASPGQLARYEARYNSLKTQWEENFYDNDNDIGKRELIADIEHWNTDLTYKKTMSKDFWFGTFFPNVYDQFECIDITGKE